MPDGQTGKLLRCIIYYIQKLLKPGYRHLLTIMLDRDLHVKIL